MSKKLEWKLTNNKAAMVGFYREFPLYTIELTLNLDPHSFDELVFGRVVACAHPHWAKLCENKGFNPKGVLVKSAEDNLQPSEVSSEFRVTSDLVRDDSDAVKFMKQLQKRADIDFAFRQRHIKVLPANANAEPGGEKPV